MNLLSTGEYLKLHKLGRVSSISIRSGWREMTRTFYFSSHKKHVLDEFLKYLFIKIYSNSKPKIYVLPYLNGSSKLFNSMFTQCLIVMNRWNLESIKCKKKNPKTKTQKTNKLGSV